MKLRALALFLALTLALPLAVSSARAQDAPADWAGQYRAFLTEGGFRRDRWLTDSDPGFTLHDMDGDGLPELIAADGTTARVYRADSGEVIYAGSVGTDGTAPRVLPGSGLPGLTDADGGAYWDLADGQVRTLPAPAAGETVPLTLRTHREIQEMGWTAFVLEALSADNTLYRDLPLSHWAWSCAGYVTARGLMTGTGDGAFSPGKLISRAQVALILYRMEGSPAPVSGTVFSDVSPDAWYGDAASWAGSVGIFSGETFSPGETMERQDLIQALFLYARYRGVNTPAAVAVYFDWDQVREDCVEAMYWAVGAGLISGTGDGRLDPAGSLTRAQLAAMVQRFCQSVLGQA